MNRPAIHPGEHLADELRALHMSAAELARRLRVPTNCVTSILHGQRAITGIPPYGWGTSSARRPSSG
jgi:antitoxin HigA-1